MSFWDFTRGTASVRLLVEFGRGRGVPLARLLARSGIGAAQLDNPNVEITSAQELAVVENLLQALGHPPGLGLEAGARYTFSTYGMWGFGLVSSATAGAALDLALRFVPLTFAFTLITRQEVDGLCVLSFGEPEGVAPRTRQFLVERDMAAAARLLHETFGPGGELRRFTLKVHEPFDGAAGGGDWLARVPIARGAPANSLAFDQRLLASPLPQANAVTVAMCEQACAQLMAKRQSRLGTAQLVRQYLGALPAGLPPALPQVARMLNLSERTLKRRLQEEGSSFRVLLAEVQDRRAAELLADGRLSLTEIAERLGFSDLSSFSQAYKRRFGVAPSVSRRLGAGATG
jgi:AraC-like DNA-binding protein